MCSFSIHFLIERHREALLFSAIVLRADINHDGSLDAAELNSLLSLINASPTQDNLDVAQPSRNIPVEDLLKQAELPLPQQSKYEALSANGYSLARAAGQTLGKSRYDCTFSHYFDAKRLHCRWIDYSNPGPRRFCSLNIQQCFRPSEILQDSSDLFKHIAFAQPECGDCLILALLGASGTQGLEAFLPPHDKVSEGLSSEDTSILDTAVLPLTKSWRDADFSLASNVPKDISFRSFATRLLLRYSYTNGYVSFLSSFFLHQNMS